MRADRVIKTLKDHEGELRQLGIASLSLFGSVARRQEHAVSDVDIAITLDSAAHVGAFAFAAIAGRLGSLLEATVDVVGEPARKPAIQREIDRDRRLVF